MVRQLSAVRSINPAHNEHGMTSFSRILWIGSGLSSPQSGQGTFTIVASLAFVIGSLSFDKFAREFTVALAVIRHRQIRPEACPQPRFQFVQHHPGNNRKIEILCGRDRQPYEFDQFSVGVNDVFKPTRNCRGLRTKEPRVETTGKAGRRYRTRNKLQYGRIGIVASFPELGPWTRGPVARNRPFGADDQTGLLKCFADRGQSERADKIVRRWREVRQKFPFDRRKQGLCHRHESVGGIQAAARENEFPGHKLMTRMSAPEQNFGRGRRPVDDDERGGVLRRHDAVDAVTLAVHDVARDLDHVSSVTAYLTSPQNWNSVIPIYG